MGRDMGIALLAGTQQPSLLNDRLKSNISTILAKRLSNMKDVREIGAMMGLDNAMRARLQNINPSQLILRNDDNPIPKVVSLPDLTEELPQLTNAELLGMMQGKYAELTGEEPAVTVKPLADLPNDHSAHPPTAPPKPTVQSDPMAQWVKFLKLAAEHPELPIRDLYAMAGLGAGKGTDLVRKAVAQGLAEGIRVLSGGRGKPRLTLRLTDLGRQFIERHSHES